MTSENTSGSSTIVLTGGELDGDTFVADEGEVAPFVSVTERAEIWYDADCFCILQVDEEISPEVIVAKVFDPFTTRYDYELSHVDEGSGNRIYVPASVA